jgi:hypothetical protein
MIHAVAEAEGDNEGEATFAIDDLDIDGDGETPGHFDDLTFEAIQQNNPAFPVEIQLDPVNRTGTLCLDSRKRNLVHLVQKATEQQREPFPTNHADGSVWALNLFFKSYRAVWFNVQLKDRINKGLRYFIYFTFIYPMYAHFPTH